MNKILTLLTVKPHLGGMFAIGSVGASSLIALVSPYIAFATLLGGFAIMVLTLALRIREWRRKKV